MFNDENIREARQRGARRLREEPHVIKAHYDSRLGRIIISLSSRAWFAFCPQDAQGLEHATTKQLKEIEITPSRFGIEFPQLDAQFDVGALMLGRFGSRAWMARHLGAKGGSVRSEAKTAAAQANGKLGGRPRKSAAS